MSNKFSGLVITSLIWFVATIFLIMVEVEVVYPNDYQRTYNWFIGVTINLWFVTTIVNKILIVSRPWLPQFLLGSTVGSIVGFRIAKTRWPGKLAMFLLLILMFIVLTEPRSPIILPAWYQISVAFWMLITIAIDLISIAKN